ASGLAHEIRNPLNAMNMNLQMIEEELVVRPEGPPAEADADTRSLLESTKGEIKRLERLVNNFLAYARPSTSIFEERDVNRMVEEIVRFLKAELSSRGVQVAVRPAPELPRAGVDEPQLKQALLNILINAGQALGPDGLVEVSTELSGQG